MGGPPLPAPTETESTTTPTELATDVSRQAEDRSHLSIPDDGTPVTITTRPKANSSRTSLLIEYFEGGKTGSSSNERKASVRVRVTPSRSRKDDHIQITKTKSGPRRVSLTRRAPHSPSSTKHEKRVASGGSAALGDLDDEGGEYASATEESNVSRNPIEVEIDRSGHRRRTANRPASPLIPATSADNSKLSYQPPETMSEFSAIPTDSFLDGSGSRSTHTHDKDKKSTNTSKGEAFVAGAAAGMATALVADKMRSKSSPKERVRITDKTLSSSRGKDKEKERERERERERDKRYRSSGGKSRTSSISERYTEETSSPRRRSSRGHNDVVVSALDSSVLSSHVSGRSADTQSIRSGASKSSINNPKLLETVEDAIRRLILPELDALKREQSKRGDRRDSATSSGTSISRDDVYVSGRRRSSGEKSGEKPRDKARTRESRDREARHDLADSSLVSMEHEDDSMDESEMHEAGSSTPKQSYEAIKGTQHSHDGLKAAAGGLAVGGLIGAAAAAINDQRSPSEDRTRRRRRLKNRSLGERYDGEHDEVDRAPPPAMPLMSEINPSEVTRTSILSAESERAHSASEELTPVHDVRRGIMSSESSPTPTRTSAILQQSLGTQHANISTGDLKALPRRRTGDFEGDAAVGDDFSRTMPPPPQDEYYDEEEEEREEYEEEPGASYSQGYYNTQDVPAPLKYVPYHQERRGLSPIPSVSGYTEGGSEMQHQRDSRATHTTTDTFSSPEKSPFHDGGRHSPSSVPSNMRSREFDQSDRGSLRSSGIDYNRNTTYTDESELDRIASGQAVRGVGANPSFVHAPIGVESAVASLVDGSMVDASVLTAGSGYGGHQHEYDDVSDVSVDSPSKAAPAPFISKGKSTGASKASVESQRELHEGYGGSQGSEGNRSQEYTEYELDEHGHKVDPRQYRRQSPTASEAADIAAAAVVAIANAARDKGKHAAASGNGGVNMSGAGVARNRSFKERTQTLGNANTGTGARSLEKADSQPKLGASGIPVADDPIPEIGFYGYDDDEGTNPSVVASPLGGHEYGDRDHWPAKATPLVQQPGAAIVDNFGSRQLFQQKSSGIDAGNGLGITEATAGNDNHDGSHSRQPSHELDERPSAERKRDTLVTNPYEGDNPIVNLPGLNDGLLTPLGFRNDVDGGVGGVGGYPLHGGAFHTGLVSPAGGLPKDEGYMSEDPTRKGKDLAFDANNMNLNMIPGVEDPFLTTPKHQRHLSGLSQGMASPLYDAATGTGIDRIGSKDIIALMQHLSARDAQRTARDTEMIATLVATATDMRKEFVDLKRILADTEDVIITEVKENTDKSISKALGGPRPFPGSAPRSVVGAASQAGKADDLPTKRRNIIRRALGLSSKGSMADLGRIEVMLNQLLKEVDELKYQTAPVGATSTHGHQSFENLPAGQYEQDHGYEADGHAGTSTASHASQSGSISQTRNTVVKPAYDRRFSENRISTVHEATEEEYEHTEPAPAQVEPEQPRYNDQDMLTPGHANQRGSSLPLATPPEAAVPVHASLSNDNTPKNDKAKKHSSRGSASWFPKSLSRWSGTTTSTVTKAFRNSKGKEPSTAADDYLHDPPSRSGSRTGSRTGSDLAAYQDDYDRAMAKYSSDKLHTGFSQPDLMEFTPPQPQYVQPMRMTPEDPKYKAHRNSVNLQHPQPRSGQAQQFQMHLASQTDNMWDSRMSPRSAEFSGSATSLQRFHQQQQQQQQQQPQQQQTNRYSTESGVHGATGHNQQRHSVDVEDQYSWSPAANSASGAPPRPPKEPLDADAESSSDDDHSHQSPGLRYYQPQQHQQQAQHHQQQSRLTATPPRNSRISKLQKGSPLPHHSVESGYGTMAGTASGPATHASYSAHGGSPRPAENRNSLLSGVLNAPARRPSGPRAMTPKSVASAGSGEGSAAGEGADARRRKRDTFGTIASQDSETF